MPPTGAFGANTGIQDAHNLAWKLALVLKGVAHPNLLTTYDTERRSIAEFTTKQTVLRSADIAKISSTGPRLDLNAQSIVDDLSVMLGYLYQSEAILSIDYNTRQYYEDP